jgi:ABC-type transport system substrate-binding protein
VVEYREHEGEQLRGDSIVEVAPDGTQTQVWSAWDCWDPSETLGTDLEFGWTWVNALDYDDEREMYIVGSRNFSSIIGVDPASGTCPWAIGGTVATVELTGGSSPFLHQHQSEITADDHLIVFDNDGSAGMVSRVIEYALDWDAGTAEQVWSYTADPTIYTFVLGDVARMPDGSTLVDWSGSGQLQRVSADGEVTWQLNTDLGYAFGFLSVEPSVVR